MNVDILGISKLKWTRMGEFNSDDHYIYYCGQKSLRRNGVAIMVNKRVWSAVLECNLKNDRMISVCFQGKPFKSMPQPGMILWWPPRTNTQKRCPFHYRRLECKSRKSRNTWNNRQIWPWNTEWSRQRLIEFCQENALVLANILYQQHKRRLYTWTSPGGQHQNQIDYILCSQRWRSSIESAKTRPGADCGSDHELLMPNSDLNWRK